MVAFLLYTKIAGLDEIIKLWDLRNTSSPIASYHGHVPGNIGKRRLKRIHRPTFFNAAAATASSSSIESFILSGGEGSHAISMFYYKVPGGGEWIDIEEPMNIPQAMHDVPIQFGVRVKKEWQTYHHFSVRTTKLAGGPALPIPTKVPTISPTETRTLIITGTNYQESVCPTTLDRSSVNGNLYEVRGVGGGGAMSGLSISPWNNLWFVGTDMGTLFKSTDAG